MIVFYFIIFSIFLLFLFNKKENFDDEPRMLVPSNEFDGILDININKNLINEMNDICLYLNEQTTNLPIEFESFPASYKNRYNYIEYLYDKYIDDFLDVYITNRFDGHTFLDIKYKYPSYYDINLKYPDDKIERSYERIYADFLNQSVRSLYENINNNLDKNFYLFTLKNTTYDEIKYLNDQMKNISVDNFKNLFNSIYFRNYIIKIFKNLNIELESQCSDKYYPFTFTFKELNDENVSDILNLVDDFINNEISLINI